MKFRIWRERGVWWLKVPPRIAMACGFGLGSMPSTHSCRTFAEIVSLMNWCCEKAGQPLLRAMEREQ